MTNFLSLRDFETTELMEILDRGDELREAWRQCRMPRSLENQRVAIWFFGQGFRNRMAFEIGAREMGANVSYVPGELGVNEPLEDIGHYLRNWFTMLVIRAKKREDLLFLARSANIPVIDARTDKSHPCEIMGDLQFIRRHRGSLDGLSVAFVGEPTNLCMSWLEAATVFPISVSQICPEGYEVDDDTLSSLSRGSRGEIRVTNQLSSLNNVDVIYTDCWPKPHDGLSETEIESSFLPYQIDETHLSQLREKGLFLPCPPVTRGQEVSEEAMNSPLCMDYQAKDDLLHIQNAIMEYIIQN